MSKSGFVYGLSNKAMPGLLKVGMTTRDPRERAEEMFQTNTPFPFTLEEARYFRSAKKAERKIHELLDKYRVTPRREFFRVDLDTFQAALQLIKKKEQSRKKTFYIVDGSSCIYRAYNAMGIIRDSKGFPVNAIYGFALTLKRLLQEHDPEFVTVTFDSFDPDVPNFRKELHGDYRANRAEIPEDLQAQIPECREVAQDFKLHVEKKAGVEAGDVIATLTRQAREHGLDVCIISAEGSLMQLLGSHVTMHDIMRHRELTLEDVHERFQVSPSQVRFVLALSGCIGRNIPGVPGIGEKTGGKLIAEFGDLETLLARIDEVSGKKRKENLREFADQARLSLDLVTLRNGCDVNLDIGRSRLTRPLNSWPYNG